MDLPIELIHKIYSELDIYSAKNLSFTSKYMFSCVPRYLVEFYKKLIKCNKDLCVFYDTGYVYVRLGGEKVAENYYIESQIIGPQYKRYKTAYSIRNNIMYIYNSSRYSSAIKNYYSSCDYLYIITHAARNPNACLLINWEDFIDCMRILKKTAIKLCVSYRTYNMVNTRVDSEGLYCY